MLAVSVAKVAAEELALDFTKEGCADDQVISLKSDGETCTDTDDIFGYGGDCTGYCNPDTMKCTPYTPDGASCSSNWECKGVCDGVTNTCVDCSGSCLRIL